MPTSVSPAETVRKALATPSSCSPTVGATLHGLLNPAAEESNAKPTQTKTTTTTTRRAPPSRSTRTKTAANASSDATKTLSGSERYKLATDVVNISLKVLTSRSSPSSSPTSKKASQSGLTVVAECARFAFSYLRAARPSADESLQLETGMLALATKLVAHGMDTLAMKELRILKTCLQKRSDRTTLPPTSDKETLATLLHLECRTSDTNVMALVVSYHLSVLRLIVNSGRPATVDASLEHLLLFNDNSPASLILRLADQTPDKAKAARQLDSLSKLILSMCPSPSASSDQAAQDHKVHASPDVVFKLQITALLIQKEWWHLAGHKANLDKELHEPLVRYLDAYRRRAVSNGPQAYTLAIDFAGLVFPLTSQKDATFDCPFAVYRSLSLLAESFGMYDKSIHFNKCMALTTTQAPESALKHLICTIRSMALQLDHDHTSKSACFQDHITSCRLDFEKVVKETTTFLDDLLVELAKLRKTAVRNLTNETDNQATVEMHDSSLGLCEVVLFCTDVLVWYYQHTPKILVSRGFAPRLVNSFISSSLFTCRLLSSSPYDHLQSIQNALQSSISLVDAHNDTETQHLLVTISNVYWRCFQLLVPESKQPSPQAVQCLQASVEVLRDRPSVHQEDGFLAMKLEKLGSIVNSCSTFAESIRIQLRAGMLRDLTQAAACVPLTAALETRSKAQLLKRNLREYHTTSMQKSVEGSIFFDEDSLEPSERATLLEIQLSFFEEDLFKPSRRRRIALDLQAMCRHLLEIYNETDYPLRRARICAQILKYSKEYQNLLDTPTIEKALTCKVDPESLGLDIELHTYAHYLETVLSIAQTLHTGQAPVNVIADCYEKLFSIVELSTTWETLKTSIDDVDALVAELRFAATFMAMKGNDNLGLKALQVLSHLFHLWPKVAPSSVLETASELALLYLHLGYSSEACRVLEESGSLSDQVDISALAKLRWHLASAETRVALGRTDIATKSMTSATECLRSLPIIEDAMKVQAQIARARFAFVCSLYSKSTGQVRQAMVYAKRYAALCQQTLAFLERQYAPQIKPHPSDSQEELVKRVDNLTISESDNICPSEPRSPEAQGAAFSAIVPDLLRSFLHLSEMYAHQGLRAEALYYLDLADKFITQLGVPELRTKILVQKEAQAYIEGVETIEPVDGSGFEDSIDMVKLGLTRGDIYAAGEDTWENAQLEYEKAESMAARLTIKTFGPQVEDLTVQADKTVNTKAATARNTKRTMANAPHPKARVTKAVKSTVAKSKNTTSNPASDKENIPFSSLCAAALRQRGLLLMNQGETDLGLELLEKADAMKYDPGQETLQQVAMAEVLLRKFGDELALDFTFNVLPESTISFPALSTGTSKKPAVQPSLSSTPVSIAHATTPKKNSRQKRVDDEFARSLCEAQERIMSVQHRSAGMTGMSVFHQMCGLGSKAMLLLSAINAGLSPAGALHPTRAACSIEMPRIEALSRELSTMDAEKSYSSHDLSVQFPDQESVNRLSASRFQQDYIDIIPNTWTVVSLTLNEDHSELYIVRYRAKQAPFLLRLPMTRNKMQDLDEDEESAAFDFESGKAELQEIIELSNYSCSKPPSAMTKEAKQSWWDEREALDLRMQELLVNIENIWLGGFRGVLSQHNKDPGLLARFRKSFEGILDRHLPSRQGTKGKAKKLVLDSNILELFVGLGDDHDGEVDMDEQVLDLLYFVIDVLQFNGERNAYDEVDFDIMATETMDALRSYHEAANVSDGDQNHLILILDRKLHAFPWESLPCLQEVSVSRVGSMLTLRERILAMRRQMQEGSEEKFFVNKTSGATILNPSGDLSRTQTTMAPLLDSLSKSDDSTWQSIANHSPTEKEFAGALSDKNMLLYFGHGSGNQYIRNRVIKKLDTCAEVVWLMGCSSGTVTEHGNFEPTSVPLSYLVAGERAHQNEDKKAPSDERKGLCMAVVATLWDVTDKDIDRFSVKLGEQWGLWSSEPVASSKEKALAPPKTPRKRGRSVPKTPSKTPSRTPGGRSRSRLVMRDEDDRKKSLVEAVAKSRDACNLRYLNGAATVVYGVPVYLGN